MQPVNRTIFRPSSKKSGHHWLQTRKTLPETQIPSRSITPVNQNPEKSLPGISVRRQKQPSPRKIRITLQRRRKILLFPANILLTAVSRYYPEETTSRMITSLSMSHRKMISGFMPRISPELTLFSVPMEKHLPTRQLLRLPLLLPTIHGAISLLPMR